MTVNITKLRSFICPGHSGIRLEEFGEQTFHPDIEAMIVQLGYGEYINVPGEKNSATDPQEDFVKTSSEWSNDDESESDKKDDETEVEPSEPQEGERKNDDESDKPSEKSHPKSYEDKSIKSNANKQSTHSKTRGKK